MDLYQLCCHDKIAGLAGKGKTGFEVKERCQM